MSGIVGIWNLDGRPLDPSLLHRMMTSLAHRGPDGAAHWIQGPVGIACQLLRVTPESLGEIQPLVNSSGVALVFDGRLDNRSELLDELKESAGVCDSSPDPELVLGAYSKYGEHFGERLLGDFALGLFDPRTRQMVLARDAIGVRPLYYYRGPNIFLFASEIKALLTHPGVTVRPNEVILAEYLLHGLHDPDVDDDGMTFFDQIFCVVPSHLVVLTAHSFTTRRYWDFDPGQRIRLKSFRDYAEAFRQHFETAVSRRLRSTRPVAITVSGGLDSSSIYCVAEKTRSRPSASLPDIAGLSWVYEDGCPSDEKKYLRDIEQACRTTIRRLPIPSPEFFLDDEAYIWHVETPMLGGQRSATDALFRASNQLGARVLLFGSWGDQLLIEQAYLIDLLREFRWSDIWSHLRRHREWDADVAHGALGARFFLDLIRYHTPESWIPALREIRRMLSQKTFQEASYTRQFRGRARRRSARRNPASSRRASAHARAIYQEARARMYASHLEVENKAAALHHVEPAYPFLDRDLVSFLMSVPGEMQTWDGVPKGILREGLRGTLPAPIAQRRTKADFTRLVNEWTAQESPRIVDRLIGGRAIQRGFVRQKWVNEELGALQDRILGPDCRASWHLQGVGGLELWLRLFFERSTESIGDKEERHYAEAN